MIVLHIVLRHFPVVFDSLFSEKIHSICFLQKSISHILFIFQNQSDRTVMPSKVASRCSDAVPFQSPCDLLTACSLQIFPIDSFYGFRLFRIDDKISIFIFIISQKTAGIHHYLSLLEPILHSQLDILTQGFRFLLCQ